MTYKAAIIGVGAAANSHGRKGGGHQIGYTHAEMYQRSPRCQLVAGVDINAQNLSAFRDRFNVPQGFADTGEMLRAVKPDIVSIATYVGLHRGFLEQCARAGVNGILCEKPFLASPADIAPVRAIATETGVKIVVAHIRRFRPAFVRARELIRTGAIGTPQLFFSSLGGWDLSEMGSHWFDLMRFFNQDDEVRWVMGQARVRDTKGYGHCIEENAVAHFAFANGVRGLLEAGEGMNGDANFGFVLVGSAGVIRIRAEQALMLETLTGSKVEDFTGTPPAEWSRIGVKGESNEWTNLWDCTLADLIGWIEGGPAARSSLESGLRTLEVNHGAYLSALKGDRVDLPLAGELLQVDRWPVDVIAGRR
jgi:predicted dehydrogenase